MNSYIDELIDLFIPVNEEKWNPEAARQKANVGAMAPAIGREHSPNIAPGASPTKVGDKGVIQRGTGRSGKKRKQSKNPLSDSIDRLHYLLETVASDVMRQPDWHQPDETAEGKEVAQYSKALEQIHKYLRSNYQGMMKVAGQSDLEGLKRNLTQGIDGVGRSHAMMAGIEAAANETDSWGRPLRRTPARAQKPVPATDMRRAG